MNGIGSALLALTKGRQAVRQRGNSETEMENAIKMQQLKMAIEQAKSQEKTESPNWQTQETEDGLVQVNPITGEARPVTMGGKSLRKPTRPESTPSLQHIATEQGIMLIDPKTGEIKPAQVGGQTLKPPPQKWQVYGPGSDGGSEQSWQVLQTDDGIMQINPKTGETRPVSGPGGTPLRKPLDATTRGKVAENKQISSNIDAAIAALDTHPTAVGLTRGISDALDQRIDPEGVDARALIANIGSLKVHQRSGASVTISEAPRLKPFIPSVRDDSKTIKKKLARLRQEIEAENSYLTGGSQNPEGATQDLVPNDKPVKSQVPKGMSPSGVARGDYLSDADYWEMLKGEGMTDAQATAKVLARKKRK